MDSTKWAKKKTLLAKGLPKYKMGYVLVVGHGAFNLLAVNGAQNGFTIRNGRFRELLSATKLFNDARFFEFLFVLLKRSFDAFAFFNRYN